MSYTINTNKNPVTYNSAELAVWRSRTKYKSWGDAFTNSPPAYDQCDERATTFINNPSNELVNYNVTTVDGSQTKGVYLVASAFKYLIEENTTHGNAVKSHILSQVALSSVDFTTYDDEISNSTYAKFSASWVFKLFLAYEYTLDLYSASEKTTIETWFWNAAHYYQRLNQIRLVSGIRPNFYGDFPKAYFDDYYGTTAALLTDNGSHVAGEYYYVRATNSNWIYSGSGNTIDDYTESFDMKGDYTYNGNTGNFAIYTHYDNNGDPQNLIYYLHGTRNNSQGMMIRIMSAIGIRTNDLYMQNAVKAYVQEWIKYCVFPDGTSGEYRRNGDYNYPQQGTMVYHLLCIENALIPADLFRRQNDNSLYEYSTSDGYQTTLGGPKNLELVLDNLVTHIKSEHDTANAKYYGSKSSDRLLDEFLANTLTPSVINRRFTPEQLFTIANLYYNNQTYKDTYMLALSNQTTFDQSYNYPTNEGGNSTWGAALGNYPASYFMWAEMENVSLAPTANAGSDQSISVAVTTLDGTGSTDTDGTIVSYLWEQISGPNTANILTTSGSSSIVNGLIVGDYVFRLTVTDNDSLTDSDTVTITVNQVISTNKANARVLL